MVVIGCCSFRPGDKFVDAWCFMVCIILCMALADALTISTSGVGIFMSLHIDSLQTLKYLRP